MESNILRYSSTTPGWPLEASINRSKDFNQTENISRCWGGGRSFGVRCHSGKSLLACARCVMVALVLALPPAEAAESPPLPPAAIMAIPPTGSNSTAR